LKTYLVGGAVRDQLLELPVYDRDWVVVGATEEEMLEAGFSRADAAFPVFIHPDSGEEYALARTEEKTGPGYKGFNIYAGLDVTLEQDLRRRDLTINALALDDEGRLIDVCNGRGDLQEGLLRHITPAFVEDPVRLLRIARFAAKLGPWGFRVAHGTYGLMKMMAASEDLHSLKPERVYQEMWKALGEPQPWRFFEVLHRCGALTRLIPELATSMGGQDAHQDVSAMDAMAALKRVVKLTDDVAVRFAVVMYQAALAVEDLTAFAHGLRARREETERLKDLLELGALVNTSMESSQLLHMINRLKPERQPHHYAAFLLACRALWPDRMQAVLLKLELAREAVSAVDAGKLRAQGLKGAALGEALKQRQREQLDSRLHRLKSHD
jgi:tRNA nucleotidyltransferase (CCA-adding enzyme)